MDYIHCDRYCLAPIILLHNWPRPHLLDELSSKRAGPKGRVAVQVNGSEQIQAQAKDYFRVPPSVVVIGTREISFKFQPRHVL